MSLLPYILGELRDLSGSADRDAFTGFTFPGTSLAAPARRHSFHPYRRWADVDLDDVDLDDVLLCRDGLVRDPRPPLLRLLSDDSPRFLVARPRGPGGPARKRRPATAVAAVDKKAAVTKTSDDSSQHALAVDVDVQQFRPEELSVQVLRDQGVVVVEGHHEERHDQDDEYGFVQHRFSRRFKLPDGVDPDTVTSRLTADGTLRVTAPRREALPAPKEANVRTVPIGISQAEKPAKPALTQDAEDDKEKPAEDRQDGAIHKVD